MTTDYEVDDPTGLFRRRGELGRQDAHVYGEVAVRDCYRVRSLPKWDDDSFVVDVGAHGGAFARLVTDHQPRARVVGVEAHADNAELLRLNCERMVAHGRAVGMHAAVDYSGRPLMLVSSMGEGGLATCGSWVVPRGERPAEIPPTFTLDERPLPTVTLEDLMYEHGRRRIDLLKLDCEGSEFGILAHSPSVRAGHVRHVVGEYHGGDRFMRLLAERFLGGEWDVEVRPHRGGANGMFELRRRA